MRKPPSHPAERKRRAKVRRLDESPILNDDEDREDPVNGPGKDEPAVLSACRSIKAGERE